MRPFVRAFLPILILVAAFFGVRALWQGGEDPMGFQRPPSVTRVEAVTLKLESYQVYISSQGVVEPRTQSTLIPEVPGKVIEISSALREGGFFDEGEILLRLDPLDYETAVVVAKRQMAQSEALIEQEIARAKQAEENWKRLGKEGQPGALARREPQLAEARAQVAAAKAELRKAERDLARTEIRAPYSGQTLRKEVDVGQVVSNGTTLAEIYADDYVEVRLPIRNEDLAFIDLPEAYREDAADMSRDELPEVILSAEIGGQESQWKGRVVRVAGALDARSKQLFVVAHVDDPYARRGDGTPPLRIGLFVEARIKGHLLEDVFVLPPQTVRASDEVVLIDDESRMERRAVRPLALGTADAVVVPVDGGGLAVGERLCTTRIAFPANGAKVSANIDGVASPSPSPPEGARGVAGRTP